MAFWQWSKTPANNATADPTINFAEGQSGSSLNDSARAVMARLAEYRDDTGGNLADSGTSAAYVVTTNEGLSATPTDNTKISFTPANTNVNGVTLQADGGTAFPIQSIPGTGIGAGTTIAGVPYDVVFKLSVPAWILKGVVGGSPAIVPIGGMIDFIGTSTPSSNFIFPFGQAISRTTYATLFALIGTTYGAGDGVSTFNVIDMRGYIGVGLDNMGGVAANRIPSLNAIGVTFGETNHTLLVAELATFTPGGNIGGSQTFNNVVTSSGGQNCGSAAPPGLNTPGSITVNGSNFSFTGNPIGSSTPHNNVQPSQGVNKLLRII